MNLVSVFELLVLTHMLVDDGETTNLMWHLVDSYGIITRKTCDPYISGFEYGINYNNWQDETILVSFQCKSRSHPTHLGSRAWRYNHICIDDKI